MKAEVMLKEYQLKKYGKCFQCGEMIQKSCKAVCINCGYKDSWEVIITCQEDKYETEDA